MPATADADPRAAVHKRHLHDYDAPEPALIAYGHDATTDQLRAPIKRRSLEGHAVAAAAEGTAAVQQLDGAPAQLLRLVKAFAAAQQPEQQSQQLAQRLAAPAAPAPACPFLANLAAEQGQGAPGLPRLAACCPFAAAEDSRVQEPAAPATSACLAHELEGSRGSASSSTGGSSASASASSSSNASSSGSRQLMSPDCNACGVQCALAPKEPAPAPAPSSPGTTPAQKPQPQPQPQPQQQQLWQLKRPQLAHCPRLMRRQLRAANHSFTLAEVAQHKFVDDCWIVVDGCVYDITEHVAHHPSWGHGGISTVISILAHAGSDCSAEFHEIHRPYPTAHRQLRAFYIGPLAC